ncbi:hypothetical protein HY495_03095 [Candidatus Woesearchaeota archaeon]|nr:hypothetical protein [Candidatus Woesearchaeota archaeon]
MKRTLVAGAAMLGLAGLLGGCDEDQTWVKDKCTKGDLVLEAEYVSLTGWVDGCNLYIMRTGITIGNITNVDEANPGFTCDDGRYFDKDDCSFVYAPKD